jgi:altronate dehydratase small subunit
MAGAIQAGVDVLVMDPKDQVATAIRDLKAGQTISYSIRGQVYQLVLKEDIPFGHKVAIHDIASGEKVYKYGEVIGRTTACIPAGHHVHVQNVEGIRGRGDQARTGQNQ